MNRKINHLAAAICVILLHVVGFLWYGPIFGEKWIAMVELDPSATESGAGDAGLWITNFVASVAQVYLIAWLLATLDVTTGIRGAVIAFSVTLCMHHLPLMSGNMFAGEPYGLAWITGGFALVALTICGFILGAWTRKST